ncbi:hypothetical protein ACE6H2_015372 [Prunus campanulata]
MSWELRPKGYGKPFYVIEELDDNYGAIVPAGGGVSQVQKVKKTSVLIEELNDEGLNQEVGGQGKNLNEQGLNQVELNEQGLNRVD